MANWGYTISSDNQINIDNGDFGLLKLIVKAEPSFAGCISCGACAGTCTARENGAAFSLLHANIMIARGQTQKLLAQIGNCMLCGKCMLICPRGVNTRNAIVAMKNILKFGSYDV